MARVNGKPGRWAKGQAERRMVWFYVLMSVTMLAYGACLGFFLGRGLGLVAAIPMILAAASSPFLFKLVDRQISLLGRQRIRYWRGAQAEAFVGWLLQELEDDWHVFHGIQLEEARDIDHIVVGPGGVYCISTKSTRGLFSLQPNGRRVFLNNQPTSLIGNTQTQAMALRDRLKALLGADVPFVNAVLAVPLAYTDFSGPRQYVWVLHQDNLTETLKSAPKRLDNAQVARVVKALDMLSKTAREVYRARPRGTADAVDPVIVGAKRGTGA